MKTIMIFMVMSNKRKLKLKSSEGPNYSQIKCIGRNTGREGHSAKIKH